MSSLSNIALTWPIVAGVMLGALLHAAWNVLVKSSDDKQLEAALVPFLAAVIALPFVVWLGLPSKDSWPFLAASLILHIGYHVALAGAYRYGDLGLTYPIMRGLAPLLVAISSVSVFEEQLSKSGWFGVLAITVGVTLAGMNRSRAALHHRKALAFAFGNAAIIAAYTLIDGLGVRASKNALSYVLTLLLLDGIPYALLVWWQRGYQATPAILAYARRRWPLAALGGIACIGSYAIALWAMTRAPVATIAALRETSVLFAVIFSSVLLKERFGLQRVLGTLVLLIGVMVLRLG